MGKISQLLRWKEDVLLKRENGSPIKDETGAEVIIYMRVVGDHDLQEAYKVSRRASALKRAALRDPGTEDYKLEVEPFTVATSEECKALITSAFGQNWIAEAISTVKRPDEITLEDIAVDPDAPTLEEQEKVDAANLEQNEKYTKDIEEYCKTKQVELTSRLSLMGEETLREEAARAVSDALPMTVFVNRLQEEKCWRGCYIDAKRTVKAFDSYEDFIESDANIKNQLLKAYIDLESNSDEIKN